MKRTIWGALLLLVAFTACHDNTSSAPEEDAFSGPRALVFRSSNSHDTSDYATVDPNFACSDSTRVMGEFLDVRDGHVYKTVKIGNQVWMAENLLYKHELYAADSIYEYSWNEASGAIEVGCPAHGKFVQDGVTFVNCPVAMPAQGLCPDGWRLPTADDFQTLVDFAGGPKFAGKYLKSTMGWEGVGNGVDCFGFNMFPSTKDGFAEILGSDVRYYNEVPTLVFSGHNAHAYFSTSMAEYSFGSVVRCIQGEGKKGLDVKIHRVESTYAGDFGSLTDARDGHVYKTVDIGGWVWMAENLAYGSKDAYTYEEVIDAAATGCYLDSLIWGDDFGMWKSCSAKEPIQGICPDGWHVPSYYEWNVLSAFVNGLDNGDNFEMGSFTGLMLKSTSGWPDGKNGLDVYGFGAKPADGEDEVYYWSSTNGPTPGDWFGNEFFVIGADSTRQEVYGVGKNAPKAPVRCLKDGENQMWPTYDFPSVRCDKPTPYSGEYGSFTDERDGNVYRTVDVAGTVWFVDNLKYDVPDGLTFCNCGDTTSCDGWGRLYPWKEAKDACPAGWRLPNDDEVWNLVTLARQTHYDLGGCVFDGNYLTATEGWELGSGNDMLGFGAIPAGLKYFELDDSLAVTEEYCNLRPWEYGSGYSHAAIWYLFKKSPAVLELDGSSDPISMHSGSEVKVAYSVRCVKE